MRRNSAIEGVPTYKAIREQARTALEQLRKQTRRLEVELRDLRAQEQQLSALLGRAEPEREVSTAHRGRIDWLSVLKRLPQEFRANDVRKRVGEKRPSEIFAAITRWQQAKLVKRKERGVYERVDG